jgi:hypothetical protein
MFLNFTHAQCDYDVNIEGDFLLCPNETGQLYVQEFDAYQWMKRAYNETNPSPISGANSQSLDISSVEDSRYYFSVEITHDDCTESSEEVLVDGWVFLPMTVISLGFFDIGNSGEAIICEGDSMFFELGAPYDTNISWYKDGLMIPDQNSSKLLVTESGSYTVSAAPGNCPDFIQYLGLDLTVLVIDCNTNVENLDEDFSVEFFPNPTSRETIIKSTVTVDSYKITTTNGKILRDVILGSKEAFVDLSDLRAGVYLIHLKSKFDIKVLKFIVL